MAERRIALLGATGSIGRQALEVIGSSPGLGVCALSSGVQPLDELAAQLGVEHVQVGGDLTQLLEASQPDLVLNSVVGFAGVGATLNVNEIPKPHDTPLERWLLTFPSFGFLLAGDERAIKHFTDRGLACAPCGTFDSSKQLKLSDGTHTAVAWDLNTTKLTGLRAQ